MQNSGTLSVRPHEWPHVTRSLTPERMLRGCGLFGVILLIPTTVWVAWKARPLYRGECACNEAGPRQIGGGTQVCSIRVPRKAGKWGSSRILRQSGRASGAQQRCHCSPDVSFL